LRSYTLDFAEGTNTNFGPIKEDVWIAYARPLEQLRKLMH